MSFDMILTDEKASPNHECIVNSEHPYKNPDCQDGVLWGPCDCCDCYFCHVPDGKKHGDDCGTVYQDDELIEMGVIDKIQIK